MKQMKKLAALALALGLSLTLAACGGDDTVQYTKDSPEIKQLAQIANEIETVYDEVMASAAENGWLESQEFVDEMSDFEESPAQCRALVNAPESLNEEPDVPSLVKGYEAIRDNLKGAILTKVSAPFAEGVATNASGLRTWEAGGITIDLPADMERKTVATGYDFADPTGAHVAVTELYPATGASAAEITQDMFLNAVSKSLPDAKLISFESGMDINGATAAMAKLSASSEGMSIDVAMLYYYPTADQFCVITAIYEVGVGSSVEKNLSAIVDSIMPA